MKQLRGLLIAVFALAILSGLVYWSNRHKAAEASQPAADAPPKMLTLAEKAVSEVTFQKDGSAPVVVSKLADRWEIIKPEPMPADQDAVNGVVSAAASLSADRLIDDHPANLVPFGLTNPATSVTLNVNAGKPVTIDFGKDTPSGGSTYAKLAGDPRVFSVSSASKTSIDKALIDLRDKRLSTFDSEKLSRVELQVRHEAVEFGKNGQNEWQILKPAPYRADALQVDELVRKVKEAKVQLEAGKIAGSTFLQAPQIATVTFTDNHGAQTVEIRQDKDKTTYAKSSAVDGIYKIGADVADAANKTLDDFRSKKLFDFGFAELGVVTVQGVTYMRSGQKWFANGKEMDAAGVQTLVDKLRDLTATGFGASSSGSPVFTASVATQDKKRSEKVSIFRDGANTVATREGDSTTYRLDRAVVDDLLQAASAIKPANTAKNPSKK